MSSNLGTATGSIVINTSQVQQAVRDVQRASQLMNKALAAVGIGVSFQAVKQLGAMAYELAEAAAGAQETRESFNALAESVGQNADDMLSAMRAASKGMISDANLVLDANRAMLLGVADNAEKMAKLLEIAEVRGDAMGVSISDAFETLVTGLGRVSPRMLQQLGIKGGQEALDAYAQSVGRTADELSDAQKQAILFNAVVASSQPLIDAAAGAGLSAADKFEQMGAKLDNSKQALGDFLLAAGATDSLDTLSTAIDDSITQLKQLDDWFKSLKTDWDNFANNTALPGWFDELNNLLERWTNFEGHLGYQMGLRPDDPQKTPGMGGFGGSGGSGGFGSAGRSSGSGGRSPIPVPPTPVDWKSVESAQIEHGKNLARINRDTNRDIQSATEDAGRQRAETIRSYELGIAREEEDFLAQRARQQRDYEADIVRIMRDGQEREAKIRTDLDEQIASLRADSNKRLAEQEEDFQTSRQRALEDHNDDLLDAAGDLDAKRVYELQRDFAKQEKRAEDDHAKQLKRDADNQAEREAQMRESAERQIREGRDADARRLEDMRAALEQQRTDEDADRKLRNDRAAADHETQLEQQAAEAGRRIQQIQDNAADERQAQQDAFEQQLIDAGLFNLAYSKKQKDLQDQMLEDLKPFLKDWYESNIAAMLGASAKLPRAARPTVPGIPEFALGGYVPRDMLARLHAGEYVTPASQVAMGNTNNSRAITIGSIEVHGAASSSPYDFAQAFRTELLKVLEDV